MQKTGNACFRQGAPVRDTSETATPTWALAQVTNEDESTQAGPGSQPEPEPAMIISDIIPPQLPSTPSLQTPVPRTLSNPVSNGPCKTKYATDEERRKATSLALKQRWASGRMDQASKKRMETMRSKKHAEALTSASTIAMSARPVSNLRHSQDNTAPFKGQNRHAMRTDQSPKPSHHSLKAALVFEQQSGFLEEGLTPASPVPASQSGTRGRSEKQGPEWPSSPAADVDMADASAPSSPFSSPRPTPAVDVALENRDVGDINSKWGADSSLSTDVSEDESALENQVGEVDARVRARHAHPRESSSLSDALAPAQLEAPELPERSRALWDELRPYLIRHNGPRMPENGWARSLITLPKVRDPDWNTGWLADHPFNDHVARDVSALIVQVTGDPAPTPCVRCKEGAGPFNSCVVISARAQKEPLRHIVGCANCVYHNREAYCSNKRWGIERATQLLAGEPLNHLVSPTGSEAVGGDDDVPGNVSDTANEGYQNGELTTETSTSVTSPTPSGAQENLREAEPGRLYSMWPDESGALSPLKGALLPAGYQLDSTFPGRPWICPVRSCRKTHCRRADLGYHFGRAHFAALLNDNCDGTFSIKGVYRSKDGCVAKGGKLLVHAPPIVVSKRPLDHGDAGPMARAQLPFYLAVKGSVGGQPAADTKDEEVKPARNRNGGLGRHGADTEMELDDVVGNFRVASPGATNRRRDNSARRQDQHSRPSAPDPPLSRQLRRSSLISPGTFSKQEELLELEDWEVAPGRIRETSAADPDTIAFSKPYLSSAQAVPVDDDIAFRVDTVAAGNVLRLAAEPNQTRLCSVAAGKVRVTIGDEAEFAVGPHGLFKVRAGATCTVRNGMYLDAVLHTVVLAGYS